MDFKRISILISFWLILSYILLDHSQGFENRLSSRRVRRKLQRQEQPNRRHKQSGKEMALSMFSRFVNASMRHSNSIRHSASQQVKVKLHSKLSVRTKQANGKNKTSTASKEKTLKLN
ncbi:unnamed protein product [Porites evermanni]|uniref:Uncharacterized protein n=1 Tax=Porites evermanni TaxID=104178 RepID=A0ABN8SE29_9CNID|nr:unnamed protein product [Porites evermanni]